MNETKLIAERDGRFLVTEDQQYGLVILTLSGFWSSEDANASYSVLIEALERVRRKHGTARLLVDASAAAVQSATTLNGSEKSRLLRPGERVAVVVSSSLLKRQMMRLADAFSSQFEFFI